MTTPIPHDELSVIGERYLREDRQCWPTKKEATNPCTPERPDVIGYARYAWCITIDAKTSVEDAAREAEKDAKYLRVGNERYILAERYVLEPFHVAEHVGLLEFDPSTGQVVVTKRAGKLYSALLVNYAAQQAILIQIIRDAGKGGGDAEAGRRSNNGHIPAHYHNAIADYVREFGDCRANEVVHALNIQHKKRAGTVAHHLAEDARNGLIKGVRADGCPALLYPTE